jgi:hypothetical protein
MIKVVMKLLAAAVAGLVLAVAATLSELAVEGLIKEIRKQYDEDIIHEWERDADEFQRVHSTFGGSIYKKRKSPFECESHVDYQTMSQEGSYFSERR